MIQLRMTMSIFRIKKITEKAEEKKANNRIRDAFTQDDLSVGTKWGGLIVKESKYGRNPLDEAVDDMMGEHWALLQVLLLLF